MTHGGKRKNSGRKSKAEELGLPLMIEEEIGEEGKRTIIRKIYEKAKTGSFIHQQLLMAYMFGKPIEYVDHTSKGNEIKSFTLSVKPDTE